MPTEAADDAQATRVAGGAAGDSNSARIELAKRVASEFAARLGNRRVESGAPVRNRFVTSLEGELPGLASLMRGGGRGGQTRVKLFLSLLWVCTAKPYSASFPSRAWAALLGLEEPDARGARRIQEAIRDLDARKLISVQDRGGLPSVLTLNDEGGSSAAYVPPSEAFNALRRSGAPPEILAQHAYFKIPSKLWTDGIIARLRGPGIAMLLVLLCERRGDTTSEVWFSPDIADQRFKLAPATRTAGLQELRSLGLLETKVRPVSHDGTFINFKRRRNAHTLLLK
ncbi:hypothetical protein ACWIF8_16390 [Micromonospora chalcea]